MVEIVLKAKTRSLVVREVRGAYARAWGTPEVDTEHVSERDGLPEELEPGVYGPARIEVRVSGRLRVRR